MWADLIDEGDEVERVLGVCTRHRARTRNLAERGDRQGARPSVPERVRCCWLEVADRLWRGRQVDWTESSKGGRLRSVAGDGEKRED